MLIFHNIDKDEISSENSEKLSQRKGRRKRGNLAIREDVMNKNFFRAFKREYKNMFEEFIYMRPIERNSARYEDQYKSISKKMDKFKTNLSRFADHILNKYCSEIATSPDFSRSNFIINIGIFLNFWLMKRILKSKEEFEKLEKISFISYAYSHQKFYAFMNLFEAKVSFRN